MEADRTSEVSEEVPSASKGLVFVVCPAATVTGGPELLHQLTALLDSFGMRARLLYFPFCKQHPIPTPYRHYGVRTAVISDVTPDSIVVVPEIYAWLLPRLPRSQIYFWWLSVDNFRVGAATHWLRRFLPKSIIERIAIRLVRKLTDKHLCQSEYARIFASNHHLAPTLPLSDYLGAPYNKAAAAPHQQVRQNLVLYNPAKGMERTKLILAELGKSAQISIKLVPLRNMSRLEVIANLKRAKVYIDFGNHPGKDRLPREAAALGCCVITNRRGSAANAVDVPIPEEYKIEDNREGFDKVAAYKIIDVCLHFADHSPNFAEYRRSIFEEPQLFARQAAAIFRPSETAANQSEPQTGG